MNVMQLNEAPSVSALALYAKHQRNGTSPGNPKWYRVPKIKTFEFKEGLPAYVPAWTRSTTMFAQVLGIPPLPYFQGDAIPLESSEQYVREFDSMNKLKTAPIRWIKALHFG